MLKELKIICRELKVERAKDYLQKELKIICRELNVERAKDYMQRIEC